MRCVRAVSFVFSYIGTLALRPEAMSKFGSVLRCYLICVKSRDQASRHCPGTTFVGICPYRVCKHTVVQPFCRCSGLAAGGYARIWGAILEKALNKIALLEPRGLVPLSRAGLLSKAWRHPYLKQTSASGHPYLTTTSALRLSS